MRSIALRKAVESTRERLAYFNEVMGFQEREMRTIKVLVPGEEEGQWVDFMSNDPTFECVYLTLSVAPDDRIKIKLVDLESALRAMRS